MPPTSDETAVSDRLRVLLIEDDEATAAMYRYKLELDEYSVEMAVDGESGLKAAQSDPPDLIFVDLRLPRMDGFEVLEALRADPRTSHLPVVILSNYGEDELVQRGHKLGALEHLIKSQTTPAEVSGRVKRWAGGVPTEGPSSGRRR